MFCFTFQNPNEFITGMASFFDLLAKYDYEDKLKEESEANIDPLDSAPRGSMLDSD